MPQIKVTRQIDAPRSEVFALFADIAQAGERIRAIENLEVLTDGPIGVGTRWRETRTMFGSEATEEMEITEFEPDRRYLVEADSCGAHYTTELRFEDAGPAATLVTTTFESRPTSALAYVFMPLCWLMSGTLRRMFEQDMSDLADVLVAAQAS